ncbi:MAG: ribosome silencing factor [Fibromonadaceae bacterium]|jgi:ribosome-associated protein|nr:ribosome silencing factor [Fibromonadaceae bacterium]
MKKDFPPSVNIGAQILFELRTEGVELLDLRGLSSVVDWFLVGTCESSAQMQAILGELQKAYKTAGGEPASIEYKELTRWAVLDAGDIMVHLFEAERREEISLDALWSKAKRIELNAEEFTNATESLNSTLRDLV